MGTFMLAWIRFLRAEKTRAVVYSNYLEKNENKMNRNSRPEVFCKKMFLEISQNSQESTCTRAYFLKKLQARGLRPATLLKNRLWHKCFSVNFAKFLRTPFLTEHLRWLLLQRCIQNLVKISRWNFFRK